MPKLLDRLATATRPLLWLDDSEYSERLLAAGKTPWHEAAAFLAYRRKAVALLKPDFVSVPINGFVEAGLAAQPALLTAMKAKTRAIAPLRGLLADEALRAHLVNLLKSVRAAFANDLLVLSLPSPRAWVQQAYELAFGADTEIEVGADEADSASVYVAEFLRSFGECGVDALLLEECAGAEPASAEELDWYQPVINIAGHYRWDVGVRLPTAIGFSGEAGALQFVIAPQAIAGAVNGLALGVAFWNGEVAAPAPAGGFRYARVPKDAAPEQVLDRLAALR